jgi:hypothetical protein
MRFRRNNLAKAKKVDSVTQKRKINVKMKKNQLVQMQLNTMKERFQHCTNPESKA